jgi:RimJ/RimL family protein N-acetyltransferase
MMNIHVRIGFLSFLLADNLLSGETSMQSISYDKYYWQNGLVRLRAWTPEDVEPSYPSMFDSEARFLLQEGLELPPVLAKMKEDHQKWFNFSEAGGFLMFAIENLKGKLVGGINLYFVNERQGTFSIGIQIHTGERGKGYGTAAMRLLLKYAFLEKRLNKFNSGWVEGNKESEALHTKLGCIQEGRLREMTYHDGRYYDWIRVGLTKDEFLANEKRLDKK